MKCPPISGNMSILKQLAMASISFEVRSCIRGYHIYKTVQYVDPASRTRYVRSWLAGCGPLLVPIMFINFMKNILVNRAIITKFTKILYRENLELCGIDYMYYLAIITLVKNLDLIYVHASLRPYSCGKRLDLINVHASLRPYSCGKSLDLIYVHASL